MGFKWIAVIAAAIDFSSVETCFIENVPEFLTGFDKREKNNSFPVHTVLFHFIGDGVKIRIKGIAQISGLKIA